MSKVYHKYLLGELIGATKNLNMIIEKNTTYSHICPDCLHDQCAPERNHSKWKMETININDPLISYTINNYRYRSDDISKDYSESNFLYSGCSNTFGLGLPLESIWAHQLNSFLGKEKFINLGINGGSYKTVVYDVFNYIRNFGKPKGVFLLLPNLERQITFVKSEEDKVSIQLKMHKKTNLEISKIITEEANLFEFYNTIKMLEDYLFELKIPLIWATWDTDLDKKIRLTQNFRNYISTNNFEVYEKIQNSPRPKQLDNDYWVVARDNSHLGSRYHLFFASLMHEEWKRKYEKNNQ
jgi:hypothetical protein